MLNRNLFAPVALLTFWIALPANAQEPDKTLFHLGRTLIEADDLEDLRGIAVADINGDGIEDLVRSGRRRNDSTGMVEILLGLGSFRFGEPIGARGPAAGNGFFGAPAVGDFDQDGDIDIVVAGGQQNDLYLFRNTGGSIDAFEVISTGVRFDQVDAVHLTDDAHLDLVAYREFGDVIMLKGNGDGTFQAPITVAASQRATEVAYVKIDANASVDLIINNPRDDLVSVVLTLENDQFSTPQEIDLEMEAGNIVAGDFDEDGTTDFVAVGQRSINFPRMQLFRGDGTGTFTADANFFSIDHFPPPRRAPYLETPDLNGDGHLDILFGDNADNSMTMALGDGAGGFSLSRLIIGNPESELLDQSHRTLTWSDLNDDGALDVLVAMDGFSRTSALVAVPGGSETGGLFLGARTVSFGERTIEGPVLTDFNNDGQQDLIGFRGRLDFLPGIGGGQFGDPVTFDDLIIPGQRTLCSTWRLRAVDFNTDGNIDVLCAGEGRGAAVVFGDGTGDIAAVFDLTPEQDGTYSAAVQGDLNEDGFPDVAVWSWRGEVGSRTARLDINLYDPNNPNSFVRAPSIELGPTEAAPRRGIAIADFNEDGHLDVALRAGSEETAESMRVYPGRGDGSFDSPIVSTPGFPVVIGQLETMDLDGDNHLDLVSYGWFRGGIFVSLGDGTGQFQSATEYFSAVGFTNELLIVDINEDSLPDVIASDADDKISYLASRGDGTLAEPRRILNSRNLEYGLAQTDVDDDGNIELMVTDRGQGSSAVAFIEVAGTVRVGPADLSVSAVTGPEAAVVGETVTISWTVTNLGVANAEGPWRDRLMLWPVDGSLENPIPVADLIVADGIVLTEGQSQTFTEQVRVPPAAIQTTHRWQVVSNAFGDLEETQISNNLAQGATSVMIDAAQLKWGEPRTESLTADGLYFWTTTSDVRPLVIEVQSPLGSGASLFLAEGRAPTAGDYDLRSEPGADGNIRLVVPGSAGERYSYIRLTTPTPAVGGEDVTAQVNLLETSIGEVGPATAGTQGPVTLRVVGANFGPQPEVALVNGASRLLATETMVVDGSVLYPTFSQIPAGSWDLEVRRFVIEQADQDNLPTPETLLFPDALVADSSLPSGQVDLQISVAPEVRAGRDFDLYLTYRNVGATDLPAPLLVADVERALLGVDGEPHRVLERLPVLGISQDGPAEILRPGQSGRIRITARAPRTGPRINVSASAGSSSGSPDVAALLLHRGYDLEIGDGPELLAALEASVGQSWSQFALALRNETAKLSRGGFYEASGPRLLDRVVAGALPPLPPLPENKTHQPVNGEKGLFDAPPCCLGGIIPINPPDENARRDWGEDDQRNWDQDRAQSYYNNIDAVQIYAGGLSLGTWSTEIFHDHLRNYINGDGDPKIYGVDSDFSMALAADPGMLAYLEGPKMKQELERIVRNAAAALECEETTVTQEFFAIESAEGGIGLDFDLFNAAYGLGKIPRLNARPNLKVVKQESGNLVYAGTLRINIEDTYTWVYPPPDAYSQWAENDFNFRNWYLEWYGVTTPFEMFVDIGTFTISGTLADDECDEEQDEPETPEDGEPFVGPITLINVGSYDPNDKAGSGAGPNSAIAPDQVINYTIRFENLATATAAAQEVFIVDALSDDLNWNTMALNSIGYGRQQILVPASQQDFSALAEADNDPNPVQLSVAFDPTSGILEWTFRSVNAITGELPLDPFAGFLPPNDGQGAGEGWVTFQIAPRQNLPEGTQIANQASIVFDINDPIVTNVATVTVDTQPPTAQLHALAPSVFSPFDVAWTGADAIAGIQRYEVYVSVDGQPFTSWLETSANQSSYSGEVGRRYCFAVQAVDFLGRSSGTGFLTLSGSALESYCTTRAATVTALAADEIVFQSGFETGEP